MQECGDVRIPPPSAPGEKRRQLSHDRIIPRAPLACTRGGLRALPPRFFGRTYMISASGCSVLALRMAIERVLGVHRNVVRLSFVLEPDGKSHRRHSRLEASWHWSYQLASTSRLISSAPSRFHVHLGAGSDGSPEIDERASSSARHLVRHDKHAANYFAHIARNCSEFGSAFMSPCHGEPGCCTPCSAVLHEATCLAVVGRHSAPVCCSALATPRGTDSDTRETANPLDEVLLSCTAGAIRPNAAET